MTWQAIGGLQADESVEVIISDNKERILCIFQLGTEAESTQATTDIYEKEATIEVDYSPLREDLKVIDFSCLWLTAILNI